MSPKPSITFLTWSLNHQVSGGQKIILGQAAELSRRGYTVNIVTHNRQPHPSPFPDYDITVTPPFSQDLPQSDIYIGTFWPTAYELDRIQSSRKFYLIQHYEPMFTDDTITQELIKNTYRLGFNQLVVSDWLNRTLKNQTDSTSTTIKNAINPIFFTPKPPPKKSSSKLKVLGVISQLSDWKGPLELMKLFKQLKTQGHNVETIFVTADPQFKQPIPDLAIDTLIYNPSPQKLAQTYRQADLLVHTSHQEGFGLSPLESMASGTPIVAFDSGGIQEYAKHLHNAYIVPPKDYPALEKATFKLLDDPHLRHHLATQAHQDAQDFTWQQAGDILEPILQSS